MPRFSRFMERHPDISVDVQTSIEPVDLPMEGIDAAIRLAPASRALPHWTHLLEESLVPVCSPALRKKYPKLSSLELIAQADLIHMTSTTADWTEWFRVMGVEQPAIPRAGLRFDTIHMALDAASRGFGVVLGRAPLFDMEIANGQLVRLFDKDVPSGLSYWLVTMDADFQSQDVKMFRQWLLDELGGGGDGGDRKQRVRGRTAQTA